MPANQVNPSAEDINQSSIGSKPNFGSLRKSNLKESNEYNESGFHSFGKQDTNKAVATKPTLNSKPMIGIPKAKKEDKPKDYSHLNTPLFPQTN